MSNAPEERVQCSRCMHIQYADISEAPVITCVWCEEIDYCYSGDEITEDYLT